MDNSLQRILDGMIATVRAELIPRLDDEFARGQAYGIIDLLNNLKPRIDWLVTPLYEELQDQVALLQKLTALFASSEIAFPVQAAVPQLASGVTAHAVEQQRNELDVQLSAVIDWLALHRAKLPKAAFEEADAAIKTHMQRALKRDLALTPKPLFGEIAKG